MEVKSRPSQKKENKRLPPELPKKKLFKLKGNSREENMKHQECKV